MRGTAARLGTWPAVDAQARPFEPRDGERVRGLLRELLLADLARPR